MPAAMAPAAAAEDAKREDRDEIPILDAAAPVQPTIRTNFADTAFWAAAVVTAPDGTAQVDFPLPDSLTTWKVKAWTLGPGNESRPGRVAGRHVQRPARPAPGAAVLRRKGRSRALGQRPQQAQEPKIGAGRSGAGRQRLAAAGRKLTNRANRRRLGTAGRLAGESRPRRPGRHPHEGTHR